MPWTPIDVAYGVRHNRLFGVIRSAGDAIDKVIALQGTGNVPRKCLTRIGWPDPVTASLVDDDENYHLTFSIDGIVLMIKLSEVQMTAANARDMFTEIVNAALPITNPGRKINRIGVVETYEFPGADPGEVAVTSLTRLNDLGEPTDFSFRAAFRTPTTPTAGDWWNTILQVVAAKTDEQLDAPNTLRASVDYQHYFAPEVVFSPALVREHYNSFYRTTESLQQNQLAHLETREVVLGHRDG